MTISLAPIWQLHPRHEPASALALAQALDAPPAIGHVLHHRGITDAGEARRFLLPSLDDLLDPAPMLDLAPAVARLRAAIAAGEPIRVQGDYDVDGVTATALLLATFAACGLEAVPILPHRLAEGYGFQPVHVERAKSLGCRLVVTADCGSSSGPAAERAAELGIEVIVTDHHLPGCELPAGVLQINPRQAGCTYPYPHLAAAGLAYKLASAFAARCARRLDAGALLRVACLGTIADLVPLTGENRVIAALGLTALAGARSHGLRALIKLAGVRPPFTAADVGYRLGPRLNAAGRLDTAEQALELLMSRDPDRALRLAAGLDAWNRQRQAEEARVVEEASRLAAQRRPLPPVLVLWSEGWHRGVVGVAAGRLARELCRPTLLLALDGETATGSGRSVPGVDLHGFLGGWRERLERFGGHSQAVGMTVAAAALPALKGEWEEAAAAWPEELLSRRHEYELALAPEEIGRDLLAVLARLEPHGQGNPQPLARVGPLRLEVPPRLFGSGHLSARVRGDGTPLELLGWGWQPRAAALTGRFEALGYLERDRENGGPVLRLVDSRPLPPR
jgi:single-stranded-DNA-specific exonuclease